MVILEMGSPPTAQGVYPPPLATVETCHFSPALAAKYPLHLHPAGAERAGAAAVNSIPLAEALGLGQVCQHRVLLPLQPVPPLRAHTAGVPTGLPNLGASKAPAAAHRVTAGQRGASRGTWWGGCPGRVGFPMLQGEIATLYAVLRPALLGLLAGRTALWDGEKAVTGGGMSSAGCHHVHGKAGLQRRARNGPGGQR